MPKAKKDVFVIRVNGNRKYCEVSLGVRKLGRGLSGGLEAVALRHPAMPVANGLGG
jgi:hypothetical protein